MGILSKLTNTASSSLTIGTVMAKTMSLATFTALDASLRNQRTVEECLGEAQASWYRVAILRCMQLLHTGNCLFGFGKFPSLMSHFGFNLFSFQPLYQASLPSAT